MGNTSCTSCYNTQETVTYEDTEVFIPQIDKAQVVKVYDGDTFTIAAKLYPKQPFYYRFNVRVKGIDCPEMRTRNLNEKYVALLAKQRVTELILNKFVTLSNTTYDKYGRLCCDVSYEENGKSYNLSELMLRENLAVEYHGKTKHSPEDWKSYYLQNKDNKILSPLSQTI